MNATRVRIIFNNGDIRVLDKTHSQLTEFLDGVSREDYRLFLNGEEIVNSFGDSVKIVGAV